MKKSSLWIIVGILVAILVIGFAINRYNSATISPDVVKVGVIAPLSGNQAFIGQDFREGLEMRPQENIQFIFEDSQGEVAKAISAYNKLKIDGIDVLVVVGSGDEAIIPLVDQDKIPTILTVSSTGGLPAKSDYIFRYFTNADGDVPVTVKHIVDNLDVATIGIIHIQDNFGFSYNDVFTKEAEKNGLTITGVEQFTYTDFDYKTQLLKLNEKKPDAIYLIGLDYQIIEILKQAKELGINTKFISVGTIATSYAISQANGVLEGVETTAFCTDGSPEGFQEVFTSKYGKAGGFFAEMGDDITTFIGIGSKIGSETFRAETFVNNLLSLKNYEANTGLVSSTDTGELEIQVCPKVIKDSKIYNYTTGQFSQY